MFPWVRRVVMPRVAAASCGVMSDANWCDFAFGLSAVGNAGAVPI